MKFYLALIFFLSFFIFRAQETDTIVVYEEVTLYDTVYINTQKKVEEQERKKKNNPYVEKKYRKRIPVKSSDYGVNFYAGNKYLSIFDFLNTRTSFSGGAGIWYQKEFYLPEFVSIRVGLNFFHWPRTYSINDDSGSSSLSGIYFTENHEPILFQSFTNRHNEFTLPVTVGYNINGFNPFLGVSANYSTFRMEFSSVFCSVPEK